MLQEISLYCNFTIKENVIYFGKLFDMKSKELMEKLKFLVQLFELPDCNTRVNNLSGGQQRRVSLAVAMVHDPDLLVLDEPTVGMDPMLRLTIWEYLTEMSRAKGKTIVITTHYIEEARQADTVGLMRNGYLLEETSPLDLLNKYGCESLEEVFLLLSTRQDEKLDSSLSMNVHEEESSSGSYELETLGQNKTNALEDGACRGSRKTCIFSEVSTAKIVALLHKNVLTIGRDTMLMLFFFGQSLLMVGSFYLAFSGNPSDLALAVVNHDVTSPSRTCQGPRALGGCNFTDLSCLFLDHIGGPVLRKEFYDSLDEAQRVVGLGKAWGAVYLGENFTQAFEERIQGGTRVTDDAVEQGSIFTWLDMSDYIISWAVKDELYTKYRDFSRQVLASRGFNPKYGDLPMKIFEPVFGKSKVDFLYAASPGLLILSDDLRNHVLLLLVHVRDDLRAVGPYCCLCVPPVPLLQRWQHCADQSVSDSTRHLRSLVRFRDINVLQQRRYSYLQCYRKLVPTVCLWWYHMACGRNEQVSVLPQHGDAVDTAHQGLTMDNGPWLDLEKHGCLGRFPHNVLLDGCVLGRLHGRLQVQETLRSSCICPYEDSWKFVEDFTATVVFGIYEH